MSFDSRPQWHLMAKPAEGRAAMHRLPGVDLERDKNLFHWTVVPLGPEYDRLAPVIAMALHEIDLHPFDIRWDRIVATGHHVTLKTSAVPREVAKLRHLIRRALAQAGVPLSASASPPHVTLNYRWDGPAFEDEIEPIVWQMHEVLLIESLTGQAQHDPHGRFPLIPRQGLLFPWLAEHKGGGVPAFR